MATDVIDFAGGKKIYSKDAIDNIITVITESTTAQYEELPNAQEFIGKVVQYIGPSGLNRKQGYFYCSNGVDWIEWQVSSPLITCGTLPIWSSAKPDVLYFVTNEAKVYTKGSEDGEWLTVAGNTGKPFAIISALPAWADASVNKIYLLATPGSTYVTGWVKDPEHENEWHKLGGTGDGVSDYNNLDNTPTINGMPTRGVAGQSHDIKLEVNVDGVEVPVNDLDIEAYKDSEITEAFGL